MPGADLENNLIMPAEPDARSSDLPANNSEKDSEEKPGDTVFVYF